MLPIQEPLWLDHMVQHSLDLIRKHATAEPYHVAFSGGKDSVVVLDLVRRAGVPHKAVYYVTTFDPPELVRFIKREYPEVEFLKPERRFEDLVRQKQILPTRWRRYCCQSLKERRFKDAVVITGVRAEESVRRRSWLDFNTARRGRTQRRAVLCPILRWASDELWEYIEARNLPTCSLYREGFRRLGCVGCPLTTARQRAREFERWPHIEARWKRIALDAYTRRKASGKNTMGETFDEYWHWWTTN